MNDLDKIKDKQRTRDLELRRERRRLLGMTPEKALDAILEAPMPVTLVQSFAEEDLHLLVHAIGPDDALPVLALASNEQWEYLCDVETWVHDRMDTGALTRWWQRLLKADPDRFTHWIAADKADDLEYYLFGNIEVVLREHDQDPADFGDDFFSEDQTHFFRLRPFPHPDRKEQKEARDALVLDLLKRLAVFDYRRYATLLLESANLLPAEAEEEAYRLRTIRMAEKGFLPYDEATGAYQALTVEEFLRRPPVSKEEIGGRPVEAYPLPQAPSRAAGDANLFTRTLGQIQDEWVLQRLQAEFAGLCNQIISADQRLVQEKEVLQQVVDKVNGYISIGLEKIAAEAGERPYGAANLIQQHLLIDIFRVGYGCALTLKWKADRWLRASWFMANGFALSFWSESGLGVLGGLLLKKPLFYDNYATGVLYREFAALADIEITAAALDAIIAFDELLGLIQVRPVKEQTPGMLTYKNLLLTLWADHVLGMGETLPRPAPLTLEQFRTLGDTLWRTRKLPRQVADKAKEDCLAWLSARSGLSAHAISERMGQALETLFGEIEQELGQVETRFLDPRYISLFLFRK